MKLYLNLTNLSKKQQPIKLALQMSQMEMIKGIQGYGYYDELVVDSQ